MGKGWKTTDTIEQRFVKFFDKTDGCWEWKGTRWKFGHGELIFQNKRLLAHRVSYEIYKGKIPEKMLVCHKCDVPYCVNPDHLFLGTRTTNRADCVKKKRHAVGSSMGMAKLSDIEVVAMRESFKTGYFTKVKLAEIFKITPPVAEKIINRKSWKHI